MGYCSLVGLLRVHALVGDYHAALNALGPLHPFAKGKIFANKIAGVYCTALSECVVQGALPLLCCSSSLYAECLEVYDSSFRVLPIVTMSTCSRQHGHVLACWTACQGQLMVAPFRCQSQGWLLGGC